MAFTGSRFDFPDEADGAAVFEPVVIVLLRDTDGCPLDLGAWAPRSGKVGTWAGRVSFAGDAYGPRLHDGGALPVHKDLLAWLAADRDGIAILDTAQACRELATFGGPFLATGGIDHARALLNILTPPKPRVFVARAEQLEPA